MKKEALGILFIFFGIICADSASIIPTIILVLLGFVIITWGHVYAKK